MSLFLRVLQVDEIEEILSLELHQLNERVPDEMERRFQSWNSRWRREALEHYLPLGWSFGARDNEKLVGYFLGQAFLFFDGQTQSLWVEHMQYLNLEARDNLLELAVKLGREKHLQKIYFPNEPHLSSALHPYRAEVWSPSSLVVRTTKT